MIVTILLSFSERNSRSASVCLQFHSNWQYTHKLVSLPVRIYCVSPLKYSLRVHINVDILQIRISSFCGFLLKLPRTVYNNLLLQIISTRAAVTTLLCFTGFVR